MTSGAAPGDRDQVIRWLEEGQRVFGVLLETLGDYDRLSQTVATLQRECEELREEVGRLGTANGQLMRERDEIVETISKLLQDVEREPKSPESNGARPASRERRGKVKYLLRQTRPGVTELIEVA
jgi:regulator of replication initiation timing